MHFHIFFVMTVFVFCRYHWPSSCDRWYQQRWLHFLPGIHERPETWLCAISATGECNATAADDADAGGAVSTVPTVPAISATAS